MAPTSPSVEDVKEALIKMRALIADNRTLSIPREANIAFRAKYNLMHRELIEYIRCLEIGDFAKIEDDRDPKFPGHCWFFYKKIYVSDQSVWAYIKVKIENRLVIISFHEASRELIRPYAHHRCCGDP